MSVIPVLQFLSGVVRRDITASLLLECTVEAVPPATLVEIRRRDEDGDVVLSTHVRDLTNADTAVHT